MLKHKSILWVSTIITCTAVLLNQQAGSLVKAASDATITVNTNSDTTGPGCTLREAIQNANDDAGTNRDCADGDGADTIIFNQGIGTITLTSQLPTITDDLTIDGLIGIGIRQTIDGDNTYGIFQIGESSNTSMDVSLVDLNLIQARKTGASGGVVENYGTLSITNCAFTDNSASVGGAISNQEDGEVFVSNSTFTENDSTNQGGAIQSYGSITIMNSTFTGNQANGSGGAVSVGSGFNTSAMVSDTLFEDNYANTGTGGALSSGSPITIMNSTFTGNTASYGGGGFAFYKPSQSAIKIIITGSTFAHNHHDYQFSTYGGGGISIINGRATITNSTIYSNTTAVNGTGGGIHISADAILTATHTTIAANGGVEGIYAENSNFLRLGSTIISNNLGKNCNSAIVNLGGNLQYGGTTADSCGVSTSIPTGDPLLGPLADNGGETETMLPGNGSAAIDQVPATGGLCAGISTDQRGAPRPMNILCDIGAVENYLYIFLPLVLKQ